MRLQQYRTWLFDCDGVILDSNKIKTAAFAELARPFGSDAVDALVTFHVENGGLSRFRKVEFLLQRHLPAGAVAAALPAYVARFGALVHEKLLDCPLNFEVLRFLEALGERPKFVVSGGLQAELVDIFERRDLARYFSGIYGSPASKFEILDGLSSRSEIAKPAVFIGDSRIDAQAAEACGADFIFLSGLSEFSGWQEYFAGTDAWLAKGFAELLSAWNESAGAEAMA